MKNYSTLQFTFLQEVQMKENDTRKIKHYILYNRLDKEADRTSHGYSILINNNIPHSEKQIYLRLYYL